MKKFLCVFLLLLTVSACNKTPIVENGAKKDPIKFNILQFNDIHGHIQDSKTSGGMGAAGYVIDQIRAEDDLDNTIIIGNGDMLQETAISRVSYGRVVIDTMSEVGFDMMGIGNHEFDWGFDKFLAYFDGDESNGEADFPLVNSNVYYNDELVKDDNIFESIIIEKEDIKIGILSYIGDVYNSINANMTINYEFKSHENEIKESALELGTELKKAGAEIIIVNIHDGNVEGIEYHNPNNLIANLKYGDEYLIDAVINGHTHTKQKGSISRAGGAPLQVIQSSGALECIGRIDLTYDYEKGRVISSSSQHVNIENVYNKKQSVEEIIDSYYLASKDALEEVYCQNEEYISRYSEYLHNYAANLMMKATGATAAVCNTGAFRNNVPEGNFDFNALYALTPFDNHIILCTISGADLKRFYDANSNYEFCYTSDYGASIATDKVYTLAIVDYVYFGAYFSGYRDGNYVDTNLVLMDLFAADLRLRKEEGFNIYNAYKDVKIEQMYEDLA